MTKPTKPTKPMKPKTKIDLRDVGGGEITDLQDWVEGNNGPFGAYGKWLAENPKQPHRASLSLKKLTIKVLSSDSD